MTVSCSLSTCCDFVSWRSTSLTTDIVSRHDRSPAATSSPRFFLSAATCEYTVPYNPSSPCPRSPTGIHCLLPNGHHSSPYTLYPLFPGHLLILTITDQDQLEYSSRLNDSSHLHLRTGTLGGCSRRRAKEHESGRESMGIHGRAGYDASFRCRVLHLGCQDQLHKLGYFRVGIAGARGQCATDY